MCSAGINLLSSLIPKSLQELERPIFVVGCSRSGTDIFMELFSSHADLSNWSEAGQIFELNYYNPNIDHLKSAASIKKSDAIRIKTLFGAYLRFQGKQRFVNKHPQNSLRIEYLNTLFPDAIFIHVIRDGRAVASSNYQKWKNEKFRQLYPFGCFPKPVNWRSYLELPILIQFAFQWKELVNHVRTTAASILSPERYLELRYEDFCSDPHGELARLDCACSLALHRRRYVQIPKKLNSQNHKWRQIMTVDEIIELEKIIAEDLAELDYWD